MISITMDFDRDVLDAVAQTVSDAPRAMQRALGLIARGPVAVDLLRDLMFIPSKPRYPLVWTSDRQRKFVMSKLRREGKIPYQREGKHARGWTIVPLSDGIAVQNRVPGSEFVYGPFPFRQRMHGITGWPFAPTVIARYEPKFQDAIIDAWLRYNGVKR